MKKEVVRTIKLLALRCGVLAFWRYLHRREITILTVHGVMDEGIDTQWVPMRKQLSRKQLDRTLGLLSKKYTLLSMDQASDILAGVAEPVSHGLVLTFDDGYTNNFRHALPILEKHKTPAVFYVVSAHVDSQQPFWFDRLDYALQRANLESTSVQIRDQKIRIDASSRSALSKSYAALRVAAKSIDDDFEMRDALNEIAASLERGPETKLETICRNDAWSGIADWEILKTALQSDLVTIGSHTVDHIRIGCVPDDVVREQLVASKETLEARLGIPCRHFCFPNGSYSDSAKRLCAEAGYETAVTSDKGLNAPGDHLYALKRTTIPYEGGETAVLASVSGLNDALASMVRKLKRRFSAKRTRATQPGIA